MKHIILLYLTFFSINTYATLSNVKPIGFVPSSDTQAYRAEQLASGFDQRLTYTENIANESYAISTGTRSTLVNKDGCIYNVNFDCTEDSLTHQYQSKSWDTLGVYYWTVPIGITSVFVQMQGGKGGNSGQACVKCNDSTCSRKKGGNGGIGGSVVFDTVSANGGSGGAEVHYPSDSHSFTCNPANFGSNGESKNIHKNVTPNDLITITINNGHSGASVNYLKNAGSKGSTGSVLIQY